MAALSISAIRPTGNTTFSPIVKYGATLGVAVPVYLDSTDREHKAADNNASAATRAVVGLTFSPGVDGGDGLLVTRGSVVLVGATMTEGVKYYLGATPGEIVPFGDLGSGEPVVEIGTCTDSVNNVFKLGIDDTGATKA